jgi:hypothetical protein
VIFGQHEFRSPLARGDFLRRLESLVVKRGGFFGLHAGHVYGKVASDRFELRTPGSTRGHVVWVVGSVDAESGTTRGKLRMVPDAFSAVSIALMVVLAIAGQFLTTSWLQLALPLIALLAIGNFAWQMRAEWRVIADRLARELKVTIEPTRR